jgi:hypothetical protein
MGFFRPSRDSHFRFQASHFFVALFERRRQFVDLSAQRSASDGRRIGGLCTAG